jgi:hypothetical protein
MAAVASERRARAVRPPTIIEADEILAVIAVNLNDDVAALAADANGPAQEQAANLTVARRR